MSTCTARSRWRGAAGLTAMLVIGPTCVAAHAQEAAKHGVIPGIYRKGPCAAAAFPDELPAINAVLDSAALMQALASAGLEKSLVLSLRLGSLAADPPVRLIERKGSSTVTDRVVDAVRKALHQIPPGDPWAFRLLVDPGNPPILRLARSELCPPVPEPPVTRMKSVRMEEGQAIQMQQQLQEEMRLRQMVQLRVLVQPNGKPADVVMTTSSGNARIDKEQQEAMRRGHFFPAKLDGVQVAAWIEIGGRP